MLCPEYDALLEIRKSFVKRVMDYVNASVVHVSVSSVIRELWLISVVMSVLFGRDVFVICL